MSMKTLATAAVVVTLFCLAAKPAPAQNPNFYDNFNTKLLDPQKWNTYGACYSSNGQEMECVREINNGKLFLAHRNFGQTDSDTGIQFGGAFLNFSNSAPITSITTDV